VFSIANIRFLGVVSTFALDVEKRRRLADHKPVPKPKRSKSQSHAIEGFSDSDSDDDVAQQPGIAADKPRVESQRLADVGAMALSKGVSMCLSVVM